MIEMNEKQMALTKIIAELDCMIVCARLQQIELGKLLARDQGVPEEYMLNILKESSIETLAENGLE